MANETYATLLLPLVADIAAAHLSNALINRSRLSETSTTDASAGRYYPALVACSMAGRMLKIGHDQRCPYAA